MKRLTIVFLFLIAFFAIALCIQAQEDEQRVQEKVLLGKAVDISNLNPAEMEKENNNAITSSKGMLANNEQQKTEPNIQKETQAKILNKPEAIPVLTPEEAIKANEKAIRFQRYKAIAKSFQKYSYKIGMNNNRIHFVLSLLPLLLIFDVLFFWKKKKRSGKVIEYFSLPRRIRILSSVSLLAFGMLVFVPWSVYFGNSIQFPFIFQDFVNWNLRVLTISIVGACIVLLFLIPPTISDYIIAIIAGLGLCIYVQAMFMNQHLGTMDGVEPKWSEHRAFGTINLIIWFAIVLVPILLRKLKPSYFSKVISLTTGIILFLEIVATVSMVFSSDQSIWTRAGGFYYADGSKQFQLSKKKNVVVFVFDNLGSEFVKQCFERYPETKKCMKDFIWYNDARSNYRQTFPGLPHELTGTFVHIPAKNVSDLFEQSWHSPSAQSFYKQINDAGYDIRLYCTSNKILVGPQECYHEYFSNIQNRDATCIIDYNRLLFCLKQMSGFSCAPFFIKKHFFYSFDFSDNVVQLRVNDSPSDTEQIPISNHVFYKKMKTSGITTNSNKPCFLFYYTRGTHRPWRIDENCRLTDALDDPMPTTRSCFYILSEFINLLKKANIYDNTAILICSDHGAHEDLPDGLNPFGYANPYDMTFMIKPFNETKEVLSIDDSKVQSIDILPTLLQMACGDNADFKDFDGYPSFNIPDGRIRKVYRLAKCEGFPDFDGGEEFTRIWGKGTYNCLEEYNFLDAKTFHFDQDLLIRQIPLVMTNQEEE